MLDRTRSAKLLQIATVLVNAALVAACAAPAATPTSAPGAAPKTEAAKPAPAAPQAPAKDAAAKPSVQRLIMAVVPPARESNDVRMVGNLDIWSIRPMYEYLVGMDAETGKYLPR